MMRNRRFRYEKLISSALHDAMKAYRLTIIDNNIQDAQKKLKLAINQFILAHKIGDVILIEGKQ